MADHRYGLMDRSARATPTGTKLAQALLASAAVSLVVGCGTADSPPSIAIQASDTAAPQPSFTAIPGQYPQPATLTESGRVDAPVGGCVNVSGTPTRAALDIADCASPLATYRVIQRVITPDQCVADADRPFYYRDAHAQWTACLDLNWDNTYCINLDAVVTKVACDDPAAANKLKPISVLPDTTTAHGCPDTGYPHPMRRFTICTETQP